MPGSKAREVAPEPALGLQHDDIKCEMRQEWAPFGFVGGAKERQGGTGVDQMERAQRELPLTPSDARTVHVQAVRCEPHAAWRASPNRRYWCASTNSKQWGYCFRQQKED